MIDMLLRRVPAGAYFVYEGAVYERIYTQSLNYYNRQKKRTDWSYFNAIRQNDDGTTTPFYLYAYATVTAAVAIEGAVYA